MELSQVQLIIKAWLMVAMGEADADRFMDTGHALNQIKQDSSCWQALFSIGVHAANLHVYGKTDDEKAALQDLVGQAFEPVEALYDSLRPKSPEEFPGDEPARMLFYTRFALSFLLLGKRDKQKCPGSFLHETAATQLSERAGEVRTGPGTPSYTRDVFIAKRFALEYLFDEYVRQESYGVLLYLVTDAAAGDPTRFSKTERAGELLDAWARQLDSEDLTKEYEFPTLGWLDLFAEVAEQLSVCQHADSESDLPPECETSSPQFLAWKFGQTAGRLCLHDGRWHDDPFGHFWAIVEAPLDMDLSFQRGPEKTYQALKVILSLLSEYDPERNWQKTREYYISMWKSSDWYYGMPVGDIGPQTDLYWAMRIGFADKILEKPPETHLQVEPAAPDIIRDIQSTKDIASTIALRQLKQEQAFETMLQRLPPSKRELTERLRQQLITVWDRLPSKVVNSLVKAENYYRTEVSDDDAKVWFCKAVEASLGCCLVEPLAGFTEKRKDKQIAICFPPPRGTERKTSNQVRKMSLSEWGIVLETVAAPFHRGLAGLGTGDLNEFMKSHFGWTRLPDLRSLSASLQAIQDYRSGSAHYQAAISRYDKEKWELEQMRNLVLGINGPSVIGQIFQQLGAGGNPNEP